MLLSFTILLLLHCTKSTWEEIETPEGWDTYFIPSSIHRKLATCLHELEIKRQEIQLLRNRIRELSAKNSLLELQIQAAITNPNIHRQQKYRDNSEITLPPLISITETSPRVQFSKVQACEDEQIPVKIATPTTHHQQNHWENTQAEPAVPFLVSSTDTASQEEPITPLTAERNSHSMIRSLRARSAPPIMQSTHNLMAISIGSSMDNVGGTRDGCESELDEATLSQTSLPTLITSPITDSNSHHQHLDECVTAVTSHLETKIAFSEEDDSNPSKDTMEHAAADTIEISSPIERDVLSTPTYPAIQCNESVSECEEDGPPPLSKCSNQVLPTSESVSAMGTKKRGRKKTTKKVIPLPEESVEEDVDQLLADYRAKAPPSQRTLTVYEFPDFSLITQFERDLMAFYPNDLLALQSASIMLALSPREVKHPQYPQHDRLMGRFDSLSRYFIINQPIFSLIVPIGIIQTSTIATNIIFRITPFIMEYLSCFQPSHDETYLGFDAYGAYEWLKKTIFVLSGFHNETANYYPIFRVDYFTLRNQSSLDSPEVILHSLTILVYSQWYLRCRTLFTSLISQCLM